MNRSWALPGAIVIIAGSLSACGSTSVPSTGAPLVGDLELLEGTALLGPIVSDPGGEYRSASDSAFMEITGDPAEVWQAYQQQMADAYDVDVPDGLDACVIDLTGSADCAMSGYADADGSVVSLFLRMWQPERDFAGRYVLTAAVSSSDPASSHVTGTLEPWADDAGIDEVPDPRPPNAQPPSTGEQIGNGTLNPAYDLPLPDGVAVVRNLEAGMGVGGISALLRVDDPAVAPQIAEDLADQLCGYEPLQTWESGGNSFSYVECIGYAGDNPGDFYAIETADDGAYVYFSVYID